jgi:hypothetical protein
MTARNVTVVLSRRAVVQWGLAVLAAAAPLRHLRAQTPPAPKMAKAEAKYVDRPHGQQRCEICLNFQPPNRCAIVAGDIKPRGWCQYFAARENAR